MSNLIYALTHKNNKLSHFKCALLASVIIMLFIFLLCVYEYFSFNPHSYTNANRDNADPFTPLYSKTILDRNDEILSIFLNDKEQWHLNSIESIPNKLKECVILYEDKRFNSHSGIDILAIGRTIRNNIAYSKRAGASTITMQVVKILESNERTFSNKIKEAIHALRLESMYDKDSILRMYLNNAPYGGNIVGFKSASLLYFGHLPKDLTWAQAALLAVLPNQPGLMNISKNRDILQGKRDALLHRLHENKIIESNILNLALREPLPKGIIPYNNSAQHLALRLIKENRGQDSVLKSSLDKQIQKRFETKIKQYQSRIKKIGINHVAALLLDTKSAEVLAYVGSHDFLDIDGYGQIDGIRAKRSPGSLLKPLLYALSIDLGLIAPESKLIDVPIFFSNFNPKNASHKYYGLVSAKNALILSLNIPFVLLLQDYGIEPFFYTLKDIVKFSDDDPAKYGLSLVLGTKEFSMEDIAKIYLGLGNYGEFGEFYYKIPYSLESKKRLLSKGASYLTLDAMKELSRSGMENLHKDINIFSWKSGTSYGKRDAWAAGTSPQYTLVVWAGNFTGESSANLSGVESAGSLLFELLKELPKSNMLTAFNPPNNSFHEVKLDKVTGYRYDSAFEPFYIESIFTQLPKDSKVLQTSPFLRKVYLDSSLQKEIDSTDSDFANAVPSVKLFLPTNVLHYYDLEHADISKYLTTKQKNNTMLKFIYPSKYLQIIQPKDLNEDRNLIIRIANLKKQQVHWYLNKRYLGILQGDTQSFNLTEGKHELTIIGEDGSSANVKFSIEK